MSNAGKREMGPKCGSLPRNAGELAGLRMSKIGFVAASPVPKERCQLSDHVPLSKAFQLEGLGRCLPWTF